MTYEPPKIGGTEILAKEAPMAKLFSSNASFGFRLADELERAAETPEVLKRLQENVAVSS